ncbi:STAS domain-containing protein [Fusibacter sp. JL298sf-3]
MKSEWNGTSMRVILTEGLTANNVPKFNNEIDSMLSVGDSYDEVVLDLDHTENVDSVGVTFVIGLYKRLKNSEKHFKVAGASDDIQSLFKLMKLDQFFPMES